VGWTSAAEARELIVTLRACLSALTYVPHHLSRAKQSCYCAVCCSRARRHELHATAGEGV